MERTIRTEGMGEVKLRPDLILLYAVLEGRAPDSGSAMEALSRDTGRLQACVRELGFSKEELTTEYCTVEEAFEEETDLQGRTHSRRNGFRYEHRAKLAFPLDSDRLNRVLNRLQASGLGLRLHVDYEVGRQKEQEKTLMELAMADSRQRAEVLCRAAGAKVGPVLTVDSCSGTMDEGLYTDCLGICSRGSDEGPLHLELEPMAKTLQYRVEVTWQIL